MAGKNYRFTTYQDARRVRLFETNILRVSPVKVKIMAGKNMAELPKNH